MATRLDRFAMPKPVGVPYTGQQPVTPYGPAPLDGGGRGITAAAPQFPGMPYQNPYAPVSAPVPLPPGMPYGTPGTSVSAPVNLPPGMPSGAPSDGMIPGISVPIPLPPGMTVNNPRGLPTVAPTSDAGARTRGGLPSAVPGGLATPKTPGTWTPTGPTTGGNLPPTPADPTVPFDAAPGGSGRPPVIGDSTTGKQVIGAPAGSAPVNNFGPGQTVQDMLDFFINGQYADNARRRGIEQANARGLMNSSIAGGQAERAALEAVQPFVSEGMNLLGAREGRAFQGQENQLDRIQNVNNMILNSNLQERQAAIQQAYEQGNMALAAQLQRDSAQQDYEFRRALQGDSVMQQDWLSSNAFSREFNAGLAMMPVNSAMDMFGRLMQAGIDDPEVFTPQYMSGMSNFFNQYMQAILAQYFPNGISTAPPASGNVMSPQTQPGA